MSMWLNRREKKGIWIFLSHTKAWPKTLEPIFASTWRQGLWCVLFFRWKRKNKASNYFLGEPPPLPNGKTKSEGEEREVYEWWGLVGCDVEEKSKGVMEDGRLLHRHVHVSLTSSLFLSYNTFLFKKKSTGLHPGLFQNLHYMPGKKRKLSFFSIDLKHKFYIRKPFLYRKVTLSSLL